MLVRVRTRMEAVVEAYEYWHVSMTSRIGMVVSYCYSQRHEILQIGERYLGDVRDAVVVETKHLQLLQ